MLIGLPQNTSPLDLVNALKALKAVYVRVPKAYSQPGKEGDKTGWKYIKEAYIYFATEEDKKTAMQSPVKLGNRELSWHE
ncbi:hypothetical protein BG011_003876, partial [Mortierella polycephala]